MIIAIWFYNLQFYEATFLCGLSIFIFFRQYKIGKCFFLSLGCTLLLFTRIPNTINQVQSEEVRNIVFQDMKRTSDIKESPHGKSFIAQIENDKYIVFVPNNFNIGYTCRGSAVQKNVKFTPNQSITFYFLSQKITKQLTITELSCTNRHPLLHIQFLRDSIQTFFQIYGKTGEVYFNLLFGGSSESELIELDSWKALGIIHLISLSGLQINIILIGMKRLYHFFPLDKRYCKYINTLILVAYGILCIHSIAFIRIVFVKILETWSSKYLKFTFNSITTLLCLFLFPEAYYNIGFWFSFLMQMALILIQIIHIKYQIKALYSTLLTSAILFLVTLIISFVYFLPLSPIFLLTNLIFIPLFEYILLPILFIGICILPSQNEITTLLFVTNHLLSEVLFYIQSSFVNRYEALTAVISCIMITYNTLFHKTLKRGVYSIFFPLILILFSLSYIPKVSDTTLIFMDVGQGDSSILFLAETQTVILIDTGPPSAMYTKHLKRLLYSLGKTHIDHLILTHADSDHVGNVTEVLEDKEIRPRSIILPNTIHNGKIYNLIRKYSGTLYYVDKYTDAQSIFQSNQITFLNPGYHLSNENEESIVFQFRIGENHILYEADAGVEFEESSSFSFQSTTILKVSHHGSKSGSSRGFINKISPKYSIISAGKQNRYGHPHVQVLTELKKYSTIIETAHYGDITFKCHTNNCYLTPHL